MVVIGLITLITSFIWSDVLVYGLFKFQQDYISQNECINRNKPIAQCNGHCVLNERLAEPGRNTPSGDLEPILLEIKMAFLVEENEGSSIFSSSLESLLRVVVDRELKGYLSVLVKPPEVV